MITLKEIEEEIPESSEMLCLSKKAHLQYERDLLIDVLGLIDETIDKYEKSWAWLLAPDYKKVHYNLLIELRKELKARIEGK